MQDEKQLSMYEEMEKIDKLFIPQSELAKSANKSKREDNAEG